MKKRIYGILVAMLLVLSVIAPTVSADNNVTADYTPTLNYSEGNRGEQITLLLSMELSKSYAINGMHFTVEFNEKYLNYATGTAVAKTSAFSDAAIYYNGAGKLNFVWSSEDDVTFPTSFEVLQMTFEVPTNAPTGETTVTVKMVEMYTSTTKNSEITIDTFTFNDSEKVKFSVLELDESVAEVIELIEAIGEVTYPDSKEAIDEAFAAYDALANDGLRRAVYNYSDLLDANQTYKRLEAEAMTQEALEAEIAQYKIDNATALALDTEAIEAAEDKETLKTLIEEALTDYNNLSSLAQMELYDESKVLKSYITLIDELIKAEEEAAKIEGYKQLAAENIAAWKASHVYVFTLTENTVQTFDGDLIDAALSDYDTYATLLGIEDGGGAYFIDGTTEEYALLKALQAKVNEMIAAANPEKTAEMLEAEAWKDTYSTVLGWDVDSLEYGDIGDVCLAKGGYDALSDAAKALLEKEGEKITALYEKVITLSPDDDSAKTPAEAAAEWINNYSSVLELDESAVTEDNLTNILAGKLAYDALSDEAKALLGEQAEKITALYNKALTFKSENLPADEAAEKWSTDYATVLEIGEDGINSTNILSIINAKIAYDALSDDAKALLGEDGDKINALYEKAVGLINSVIGTDGNIKIDTGDNIQYIDKPVEIEKIVYKEGPGNTTIIEKIIYRDNSVETNPEVIEKIVETVKQQGGNFNLGIKTRKIGILVWVLLALAVISTAMLIVLRIFWYNTVVKGGKQ